MSLIETRQRGHYFKYFFHISHAPLPFLSIKEDQSQRRLEERKDEFMRNCFINNKVEPVDTYLNTSPPSSLSRFRETRKRFAFANRPKLCNAHSNQNSRPKLCNALSTPFPRLRRALWSYGDSRDLTCYLYLLVLLLLNLQKKYYKENNSHNTAYSVSYCN